MSDRLPLLVANLKANLNWDEISAWLEEVGPKTKDFPGTVVFCPSDPFLIASFQKIKSQGWNLKLGSQDISKFEQGAYTGEVAASQIADVSSYTIIGHSERRQNFSEDEEALSQKAENAKSANLEPIFCVQSANETIPESVKIVAYEPAFAIGSGNPDTPENVKEIKEKILGKGNFTVLYGGSVAPDNAKSYLTEGGVSGLLCGATSSLDPARFVKILESLS